MPNDYTSVAARQTGRVQPVKPPRPAAPMNGATGAASPNNGRPPTASPGGQNAPPTAVQPGNFLAQNPVLQGLAPNSLLTPPPAFRHNVLGWLNRVSSPPSPSAGPPSSAVSHPSFGLEF